MAKENKRRISDVSSDSFEPGKPQKTGIKTLLLMVVMLLAAMVIIHETILQVNTVTIVGNKNIPRETILSLAGFTKKVSFLGIRESDIQQGIDNHPQLEFEKLEKHFPSSVTIYVKERIPCANMLLQGSQYILDREGHVIGHQNETDLSNGLLCVTGINIKRMMMGDQLVPVIPRQLDAYCAVMKEMEIQQISGSFSELNVTDPENIYLVTKDGYTVRLGDEKNMRGKLMTVRGCLQILREEKQKPGILNASVPGYATYTPPNL